jgi:porin
MATVVSTGWAEETGKSDREQVDSDDAQASPAPYESKLLGSWGGLRDEMAEIGLSLDLNVTQVLQSNTHGGATTRNGVRYSGSADLTLMLDTSKAGLWDGGTVILNAEPKWGDGINEKVGSLLPVNLDASKPLAGEGCVMTLSEYFIWQEVIPAKLYVWAGKLDASRAFDMNVFANDERTQFMNLAFRNNLMLIPFSPYTSLCAGFMIKPTEDLTLTTAVVDTDGRPNTTGFETAFHGDAERFSVAHEWSIKVNPLGLPGNQRVGFAWSPAEFDKVSPVSPFKEMTPMLIDLLGMKTVNKIAPFLPYEQSKDNVMIYYNFDQYVYAEEEDPTQGVGMFGRFGWARQDVNPVAHFYSLGLGGKGIVPNRDKDTFGVGYYFADLSNDLPSGFHSEQGIECYYNIEVTPWMHITPDVQVVVDPGGGIENNDVAVVCGVRVQMSL